MSSVPGVVVRGPVVPADSADVYPTHEAQYGKGGWRAVADVTARDAIPAERRNDGMAVWVTATNTLYQLRGGVTNANWVAISMPFTQMPAQADAAGPNVSNTDFNNLLAKLRTAGMLAP